MIVFLNAKIAEVFDAKGAEGLGELRVFPSSRSSRWKIFNAGSAKLFDAKGAEVLGELRVIPPSCSSR